MQFCLYILENELLKYPPAPRNTKVPFYLVTFFELTTNYEYNPLIQNYFNMFNYLTWVDCGDHCCLKTHKAFCVNFAKVNELKKHS